MIIRIPLTASFRPDTLERKDRSSTVNGNVNVRLTVQRGQEWTSCQRNAWNWQYVYVYVSVTRLTDNSLHLCRGSEGFVTTIRYMYRFA